MVSGSNMEKPLKGFNFYFYKGKFYFLDSIYDWGGAYVAGEAGKVIEFEKYNEFIDELQAQMNKSMIKVDPYGEMPKSEMPIFKKAGFKGWRGFDKQSQAFTIELFGNRTEIYYRKDDNPKESEKTTLDKTDIQSIATWIINYIIGKDESVYWK